MKLSWSSPDQKIYETGLDRGVLYHSADRVGVAWPGLINVSDNAAGGTVEPQYFNGEKTIDVVSSEDFKATIDCFTTPREFAECDGRRSLATGLYATKQPRKTFCFSWRSQIGSAAKSDLGNYIHLAYNLTAAASSRDYNTNSENIDPGTMSYDLSSVPFYYPGEPTTYKPTAYFKIDTRELSVAELERLEGELYGSATKNARLPTPKELIAILSGA